MKHRIVSLTLCLSLWQTVRDKARGDGLSLDHGLTSFSPQLAGSIEVTMFYTSIYFSLNYVYVRVSCGGMSTGVEVPPGIRRRCLVPAAGVAGGCELLNSGPQQAEPSLQVKTSWLER